MGHSSASLEQQRAEILQQIHALGDMRRGSIVEQYLTCGKSPCCCKEAGHPGHGPYFTFTRKLGGKTQTRQMRSGPALAKLRREVESFHRFQALRDRLIEVNEALCELRPLEPAGLDKKNPSRRLWRKKSAKKSTAS